MLEKGIVYQANPLVEAIKYESIDENRLFLACLKKLNPHLPTSKYFDEDFKDIVIPTKEIIDFFGGNDKYYTDLVDLAKKLLGTYIFIEDKEIKTFRGYTVFEYIEFGKKFGGLHFKFTNSMKPFLLDLYNKGFTGINLKEVFILRSSYSLRLLELLLQYKGLADNEGKYERSFSFDKLRLILNIKTESYKRPSSFLRDVIVSPISEINKKTRYVVNYTVQRKGKKATGITFQVALPKETKIKDTIEVKVTDVASSEIAPIEMEEITSKEFSSKESSQNTLERQEHQKKLEEYTEDEIYALEKLLKFKINERKAFEILDKFGTKAVDWAVKDYYNAKNRGVAVNNPAGFIIDKIPQYESSVPTADDIFKLAEGFRAKKEEQRIKEKEETERKKAAEKVKEEERKASQEPWKDWEVQILAQHYLENGKRFSDADQKIIEDRNWKIEEILRHRKYMQYFYPDNAVIQNLARKNSDEETT